MTFFLRIVCRLVWNITAVVDSRSKQFSKEKGDQMAALPVTVGGLSVDIPVGTVRRALAIAELSGSDIYSVGTDFCFRMPDLRRLDEEVDELMGSGVPTTRGTSACASEKKSVRVAAAAAALPHFR